VTESGRQPWLVYGILRTADATSPVPSASILSTLVLFVLCYGVVFTAGIYYINRLIAQGPRGPAQVTPEPAISPIGGARPAGRGAINDEREA
jgi:cytochrome d ubiquinol oxidase subunit I